MKKVHIEETYWDINSWNQAYLKWYKPLIDTDIIKDFHFGTKESTDGLCEVMIDYWDVRGGEPWPGPTTLPPHINTEIVVNMRSDNVNELLNIVNQRKNYFPGFELNSFALTQNCKEEATMAIVLINYEPEEGDEITQTGYEEVI